MRGSGRVCTIFVSYNGEQLHRGAPVRVLGVVVAHRIDGVLVDAIQVVGHHLAIRLIAAPFCGEPFTDALQ